MNIFNLTIILLSTINSEPIDSNNYKIAKYLLENLHSLEDLSISDLANECFVSNSSISRFCKEIGLNNFNTLKSQIIQIPLKYRYANNKFNFQPFDSENPFKSYINSITDNLNNLYTDKLYQQINSLVKDIYNYQNIGAFGYMHSESIALNLQYDLQTNGKLIFTHIKFTNQIEFINNATKDTLIIIFSESGSYFNRLYPRTTPFHNQKNKPKIVLITSNQECNFPYVDEYIFYNSRKDYASHPYALITIESMIAFMYLEYLKNNQ